MTKTRLAISILGLLAVSLLVWFVGPLIAFGGQPILAGEVSGLLVILALVLIWALIQICRVLAVKTANEQIMEGIAPPKPPEVAGPKLSAAELRSHEELAVLRERFREAIEVLRKSDKKGAANLYELPWYVIIGPPGAGKTTALKNSGLQFPLADRFGSDALRGVGGTRNCDWWFTEEAVLLDTAGRFVTQDSDKAVDSAAWEGFLALLKRHRRRRPINGIIVALSLSDLLLQSERERERQVHAIKQRIQEVTSQLGFRFPIYLVVTKCDLVLGFMEFFEDLGREERAQVWGMTFALDEADSVGRFSSEYDALLKRLNERLLSRLDQERDPRRRALIYGFAQQMATLKEIIGRFLGATFRTTRYDEPVLLRGVYLTSATQEGTPIDQIMGAVARSFGLEARVASTSGSGRSYFLTNLLKRVIFAESELVGTNRRLERRRARLQLFAYGSAVLAVVGAVTLWSTAYTRNQAYANRMQERVSAYNSLAKKPLTAAASFTESLPRLDALRATTVVYDDYAQERSMIAELGVYQGDRLTHAARAAYQRELNRVFAPAIAGRLAEQLRNAGRETDAKYAALKAYLMLRESQHLDPVFLKAWAQLGWERDFPKEPDKIQRLGTHLDALLESRLQPVVLDEPLVKETRLALNQASLAELVYSRLKRDALARDKGALVLKEVLGPLGAKVFERRSGASLDQGVPGLFTYRGYYEVYLPESQRLAAKVRSENWVLEHDRDELSAAELAKLSSDISGLYFAEYERIWEELVEDLKVVSFRDPAHGLEVLQIMAGRNSALRVVLQAIEQNTGLTRPPAGAGKLVDKISEGLQETKAELAQLLGSTGSENKAKPEALLPGAAVEQRFADLNSLVRPDKNGAAPVDTIIEQLSNLYTELDTVSSTVLSDATKPGDVASGRRIKELALGQPQPVKDWLLQLTGNVAEVAGKKQQADAKKKVAEDKKTLLETLNGAWVSDILPFCNKAVASRYPISKVSSAEATLKDFGKLFGPGGLIDAFVSANLKPFIDATSSPWRWRAVEDVSVGTPNEVLHHLEIAATIRDAYFHGGGPVPAVEFALKPILLDKDVKQFVLEIGGQKFTHQHGTGKFEIAHWPAPDGGLEVTIQFEDAGGRRAKLTKEGPWALFRLLDAMRLDAVTSDRLVATFALEGRKAQYEIRATSVINPFIVDGIHSFRCPKGF